MPYSLYADLLEQIPASDLVGLTDDAGSGLVDDSVIERAIADADATIDAYCQGRYSVPLAVAPAKIRQISVDLAIYNLFARRSLTAPEIRKDRQREAIRFLEKVADGNLQLGVETIEQDGSGSSSVSSASTSGRLFSRDNLKGY